MKFNGTALPLSCLCLGGSLSLEHETTQAELQLSPCAPPGPSARGTKVFKRVSKVTIAMDGLQPRAG